MGMERETGIQNGKGKRDCVMGPEKGIGKGSELRKISRRSRAIDRGMVIGDSRNEYGESIRDN